MIAGCALPKGHSQRECPFAWPFYLRNLNKRIGKQKNDRVPDSLLTSAGPQNAKRLSYHKVGCAVFVDEPLDVFLGADHMAAYGNLPRFSVAVAQSV
ncbi:hypothetical protein SDC9_147797 [bioreactor metagenome]|uniref:Uncharacterized protein n=1 Tax=bioreactor metagenome TaxID=1076179 RepID=A0A645EFC7_9ZZZZ